MREHDPGRRLAVSSAYCLWRERGWGAVVLRPHTTLLHSRSTVYSARRRGAGSSLWVTIPVNEWTGPHGVPLQVPYGRLLKMARAPSRVTSRAPGRSGARVTAQKSITTLRVWPLCGRPVRLRWPRCISKWSMRPVNIPIFLRPRRMALVLREAGPHPPWLMGLEKNRIATASGSRSFFGMEMDRDNDRLVASRIKGRE
ncbi:hypothetical protein GQ53DRAFT_308994 [Thozetella sp. PMI_491]|nr:hypothetical protein GQ53DRAFT_308994 [Thozetella sp. PMI_491]